MFSNICAPFKLLFLAFLRYIGAFGTEYTALKHGIFMAHVVGLLLDILAQ